MSLHNIFPYWHCCHTHLAWNPLFIVWLCSMIFPSFFQFPTPKENQRPMTYIRIVSSRKYEIQTSRYPCLYNPSPKDDPLDFKNVDPDVTDGNLGKKLNSAVNLLIGPESSLALFNWFHFGAKRLTRNKKTMDCPNAPEARKR